MIRELPLRSFDEPLNSEKDAGSTFNNTKCARIFGR